MKDFKILNIREYTMVNEGVNDIKLNISKDIKELNKLFKNSGHELYVVGGAVRDALLGKTPKDWDLATDATTSQIKKFLPDSYKFMDIGEQFAITFVISPSGEEYEIATFREENYRDSDFSGFIEYIKKTKPENYEERLRLLYNMSNK